MMLGLLLQIASVVLLRCRLGKTWLRRPTVILVLASVVYQGVSPVLLAFPSIGAQDYYRFGVASSYTDEAVLVTSAGMLAFTLAYLLSRPERAQPRQARRASLARALDWRLLALSCAPLAVLTYEGRGYANGSLTIGAGAPPGTVLASSFFVILMALTAFSLVLSKGPQWFLPVLAAQSLLLAAAGERNPVIANAIVLIVLLGHAGQKPSARQLQAAGAVTVLAVLAIGGVRAQQGRSLYYSDNGLGARAAALATGLGSVGTSHGLLTEAAVRLDATSFAAAVLQSVSYGQPRLSPAGVPESFLLAVPNELWPSKLTHASALNPTVTQINDFGLQPVNFLPGFAGMYAGFLSPPWLIAFLTALGGLAGRGERWLLRSYSPGRFVMLAGALIAALSYEGGMPAMLLQLRSAAAVAVITLVAAKLGPKWVMIRAKPWPRSRTSTLS